MNRIVVDAGSGGEGALRTLEWLEGVIYSLSAPGYRHRVEIVCTPLGPQRGQFANGENNYSAYVSLVSRRGHVIDLGCVVVPVLPDGRCDGCGIGRRSRFRR